MRLAIVILLPLGLVLLEVLGRARGWDRPPGVKPVLSRRSLALIRVQAMLANARNN